MVSTDGKVIDSDEGIKLRYFNDKVLGTILGNIYGITFGIDVGTYLIPWYEYFDGYNENKL